MIDVQPSLCSIEHYGHYTPAGALERLTAAIRDVESELAAMKAEHDPLASHIFVSRRNYRNVNDTKSGKRREMVARLSFNTACELEKFRFANTTSALACTADDCSPKLAREPRYV
jgi:hypothetical protein